MMIIKKQSSLYRAAAILLVLCMTMTNYALAFLATKNSGNAYTARHPQVYTIRPSLSLEATSMKELPSEVVQYSQVPKTKQDSPGIFTATTIPTGLLKNHSTKLGTWGIIRVRQGKLSYTIRASEEEDEEAAVFVLDSTTPGVIEPSVLHQVAPLTDDVEFVVEFYRLPNTGPVDEKREGLPD